MTPYLQVLQDSRTKFIHPQVISFAFKLISIAASHPKFSAIVRPSLVDILQNCAFPKLFISQSSVKTWDEDPRDFLKVLFEDEEFNDSDLRYTSSALICNSCSETNYVSESDPYPPILAEFLIFVSEMLDKSIKENQPILFEAGLYIIGKLEEEIEKYEQLIEHVEPMIKKYVLPNITNPIGIIRMRACWIYSRFPAVSFKDGESLNIAFKEIVKALKDKDLPEIGRAHV